MNIVDLALEHLLAQRRVIMIRLRLAREHHAPSDAAEAALADIDVRIAARRARTAKARGRGHYAGRNSPPERDKDG